MSTPSAVSPLRISNETFLVASSIERCPKTMMVRELVMNALEAAMVAEGTPPRVRIFGQMLDGVRKLCVWNTGRGLSSEELLQVSNLSSSLFKTVSLDGNFGMGAKVASLSSNKHGLRYRSCREGRVSEIVLGQRDGVYGRLRRPSGGEVADVTEVCREARDYPLDHDWTEVLLMGNAAEQDTVLAPYAGDPPVQAGWLLHVLSRRFFRVPGDVSLTIEASALGTSGDINFQPALAERFFDRTEAVATPDGIVLHYCYRAEDSTRPTFAFNPAGLGAVIFGGEVYALTEGRRWSLEAPTYGFTFAARRCTVLIELPSGYAVQPEVYRQFLRFRDGDQRQVLFGDFGELVRANIPDWLRRIINSFMPESEAYLDEIKADLQHLLLELGIDTVPREANRRATQAPTDPAEADRPPSPPRPNRPTPPEIIRVEREEELVERGLGGRAARYYRTSQQIFVNVRYSAFARLAAQLQEEFAAATDPDSLRRIAEQVAEWALISRLTRAVIFGMSKNRLGWTGEEVASVQTPENLSLQVDDYLTLLPPARQRMASLLGVELPASAGGGTATFTTATGFGERMAAEVAEAEAWLQRAMSAENPRLGPYYRRIGELEARRGNQAQARDWLQRGIEADPADPWCHYEVSSLMLAQNDLDGAEAAAAAALERAPDKPGFFMRRMALIEVRRGQTDKALGWLQQAADADPADAWPLYDASMIHAQAGDLPLARSTIEAALARTAVPAVSMLRRQADIENRGGNRAGAIQILRHAMTTDPQDAFCSVELATLLAAQGETDEAVATITQAIDDNRTPGPLLLRRLSDMELRRQNLPAALVAAQHAVAAEPAEPLNHLQLSTVNLAAGDLDGADQAASEAMDRSAIPSIALFRRRAEIATRRRQYDAARGWLDHAIAADPDNAWLHYERATALVAAGLLDEAEAAITEAIRIAPTQRPNFLRRLSDIAMRRGDTAGSIALLQEAAAALPADPWCRSDLAARLLHAGDPAGARAAIAEAIEVSPQPSALLYRRRADVEQKLRDFGAARVALEQAIGLDPSDAQTYYSLSNVLMQQGDYAGARSAAEEALRRSQPAQAVAA